MSAVIQARLGRSCVDKVRVEYHLHRPLREADLDRFPEATCQIQRFSRLSRGARDHATLSWGSGVHATAALGEARLVTRFKKLPAGGTDALIHAFEERLHRALDAPVEW